MICHVSIQHIHLRRVLHDDNSRGVPNGLPARGWEGEQGRGN